MIYNLVKTMLLLGNASLNPAKKIVEVVYIVFYPLFVIICLVAAHLVIDLYRSIRSDSQPSSRPTYRT